MKLVVMMAVVALILIGVAVAVANADAGMPSAPRDLPDTGIPTDRQLMPDDVDALRFSMAPRGYRMAEVDEAMARLRAELAARDAEIEQLRTPAPEPFEPPESPEPAEHPGPAEHLKQPDVDVETGSQRAASELHG